MGANTSSPKERLSLSDLRARKSRTPNCKVSPFIVEMKKENQWKFQLNALKDTNKLSVWKEYNLYTFPAVIFMKRGQEVDRVVGLKLDEIEQKLHKYAYSF
ncbi:hypothetical protein HID58_027119 [Brassica napus]|uniref:Thioredoxin domain-containing protein n=1 Tax=Brassica napus TaxID=3708 RepID=A0ABQ8CR04_BRANA|nr:hypothetical protein HID58_027119 [Brassica napus]